MNYTNLEYCVDLDIGLDWIITDQDYFKNLNQDPDKLGHYYLPPEQLRKEFMDWIDSINCHIWYSEIFHVPHNSDLFIHSDSLTPLDSCKINWVYDQGETYMRWYSIPEGEELVHRKNTIGGDYYSLEDESGYKMEYQHRIAKPTLINAGAPHDVSNPTDHPRWCVSIVLRENGEDWRVSYKRFREILAPWIKAPSSVSV